MSFKIHLMIVSIIIIVMFIIIQLFTNNKQEQTAQPLVETSPYTITVERASWGLNCRNFSDKNADNYMLANSNNAKLKENNVLFAVSHACNVKPRCDISIDQNMLGEDPMPTCGYKILQVEYRCFSVDRIRVAKATDGVLSLDCDKQLTNP